MRKFKLKNHFDLTNIDDFSFQRVPPTITKTSKPVQNEKKPTSVSVNKSNTATTKPVNGFAKNNTSTSVKKKPEPTKRLETPPGMKSCTICGRHFADDRIEKHHQICEKSSKKKRKVFDPMKQRIKGTEAEKMLSKIKMAVKEPAVIIPQIFYFGQ